METLVIAVRDLPQYLPATAVDGAVRWDPLQLRINPDGTAVDLVLTGVTWALTISDERGGTAEVTAAGVAWGTTGVYVEDATTGNIHLLVGAADVTTLGPGEHWYELKATIPAGHTHLPPGVMCFLHGPLSIGEDAVA